MKTLNSRGAGILLHISSLPSNHGIGTFGKEAYHFVDFLKASGQGYWQVLPLGQTSYGDSPYQSFSVFAGNPYFIDLDMLVKENLIHFDELKDLDFGDHPQTIDYSKLFKVRYTALHLAFQRSGHQNQDEYMSFIKENRFWLDDYALFMSLKIYFNNTSWLRWENALKQRDAAVLEKYRSMLSEEIKFWQFIQYKFFMQWISLKTYANKNEIKIIGDLPIYVSMDSVDTWANSGLFELDNEKNPIRVAGVPPDFFSRTGQLWGNPLYDWIANEQTGFSWWKKRMKQSAALFDIIRIDHFIGFVRYFAIPAKNKTAKTGVYEEGPSMGLIRAIREAIPDCEIVAENLGVMTPEVDMLLEKTGFPGMKILLFAFDGCTENPNLPHNYTENNIVYTGTHDCDTVSGFFEKDKKALKIALEYLGMTHSPDIAQDLIRLACESAANTAIIPLQDFLGLSSEARMNTPSTMGNNWKWRYTKGMLSAGLAKRINRLTKSYGR